MLVRNVAAEVASKNVQVNAIGTNFMDFPEFLAANRAEDAEGRATSRPRCRWVVSVGWTSWRASPVPFSTAPAGSRRASSWPLPVGGPEGSPA